jgi:hypothetical protein
MGFSVKEWVFGGKTFCFCLPVRLGVVVMTFLTLVLSALLSIIIWFEVSSALRSIPVIDMALIPFPLTATTSLSSGERAAFIVAGVIESLLLIASILGFVPPTLPQQYAHESS